MNIEYTWRDVNDRLPSSAGDFPVWVKLKKSNGVDLCYLTAQKNYFVSTDCKRAYEIDEVSAWTMVDIPMN